jgi:hypothetical protein
MNRKDRIAKSNGINDKMKEFRAMVKEVNLREGKNFQRYK